MPYVDAPKIEISVEGSQPKILIVTSQSEDEVVKALSERAISDLVGSGVLETNIDVIKVDAPEEIAQVTIDALIKTRKIVVAGENERLYKNVDFEFGYDAALCIGYLLEEEISDFDQKSAQVYDDVQNIILETQVPCIMGILTCRDYEQALERAGIGRIVQGMNHGHFWAVAALAEIQVRKMISEGKSDTTLLKQLVIPDSSRQENKSKLNIAILCCQWNMEVNSEIVIKAVLDLVENGYDINRIKIYSAVGSFELSGLANYLIQTSRKMVMEERPKEDWISAVICIGSLIKGGTKHFKLIFDSVESAFDRISQETKTACISGVLCCNSIEEAKYSAGIMSDDGVPGKNIGSELVINMIKRLDELK
ncbi:hypothetical protein BB561_003099 [Smittium simulii]|uniref:6,7-dimethyl-8-ribityllumazine synthase n=1 Tax=Smittium simulii TaxID=133385 RepID=A0A2T9YMV1_9FUNG|nr:hypothetical protein BB561_003099 [Smittium simulii]